MAYFQVEGGHRLHGEITPQGAKNEALQILCATLLTPRRVVVHNVPRILDVMQLIDLLRAMGVEVEQLADDTYAFCAREIDLDYLLTEDYRRRCARLRGSVMLIGPLLARFGVGYVPKPGGDKIGRRRLDTHFIGFQKLGAKFDFDAAEEFFSVDGKELRGCYMLLDEASVTGTANIVMAAVMARGTTTIYNAACEPYVQQLCRMLNRMGARISGIASNLLTIEGVEALDGTEHTLLPDMIEVGSFIGMAAMTQSELRIRDVSYADLGIIPAQFARMGIRFEQQGDEIYIPQQDHYGIESFIDGSIMTIADAPVARVDARPAVDLSGGGHAGQGLGAHPPEDVREPPVLRRQAHRHGGAGDPVRPAPCDGHRPRPPHPPARYAHDVARYPRRRGAVDRRDERRGTQYDPEHRPDRPRLLQYRRPAQRAGRPHHPLRGVRVVSRWLGCLRKALLFVGGAKHK